MTLDDALYGEPEFRCMEPNVTEIRGVPIFPMIVATWPDGFEWAFLGGQEMLDDPPFVETTLIPWANEQRGRIADKLQGNR